MPKTTATDTSSLTNNKRSRSPYGMTAQKFLLNKSQQVLQSAQKDLERAREMVEPLGLSVESHLLQPTFQSNSSVPVLKTTGGHSNTDHEVKLTGDPRQDRLAELIRNYQRRQQQQQQQQSTIDAMDEPKWDKPKIPGERRRRMERDPKAPLEPPPSGYVVFIGQMTCKHRHDHPNEPHEQAKLVQKFSHIWKQGMDKDERDYYMVFAKECQEEYTRQYQEYRATGSFTKSTKFERLQGVGPWVRRGWHEKNGLEQEIEQYDTVAFPARPAHLEAEHQKKRKQQEQRRKLRLKGLIDKNGNPIKSSGGGGENNGEGDSEDGDDDQHDEVPPTPTAAEIVSKASNVEEL